MVNLPKNSSHNRPTYESGLAIRLVSAFHVAGSTGQSDSNSDICNEADIWIL